MSFYSAIGYMYNSMQLLLLMDKKSTSKKQIQLIIKNLLDPRQDGGIVGYYAHLLCEHIKLTTKL